MLRPNGKACFYLQKKDKKKGKEKACFHLFSILQEWQHNNFFRSPVSSQQTVDSAKQFLQVRICGLGGFYLGKTWAQFENALQARTRKLLNVWWGCIVFEGCRTRN
eukprot:TRINITY_DN93_c0_g1_i10.p1 TRINITY_DN93_c0_g1~~TRINITY_DN93_c0_g1_i10.p1  ORF type:complete len:106 (+),score=11.86 TRINITY_DN93_c0_g1_i10:1487-1804(+)